MLAGRFAVLVALLAATVSPAGARDGNIRRHPYTTAVGDLDADGARDTVSIEYTSPLLETQGAAFFGYVRIVTARSGPDASVLWSEVIDRGRLLPARLGPAAADGLLVVDGPTTEGDLCDCTYGVFLDSDAFVTFTTPVSDLALRALDGAGQVAWERTFQPGRGATVDLRRPDGHAGAGSYRDAPAFVGLLDASASEATDALVQQTSREQVGNAATSRAVVSVVDGATGSTAVAFEVATAASAPPLAFVAGDLDADGLEDVAVAQDPELGRLTARSGTAGTVLWRSGPGILPRYYWVWDFGDVTGDGRTELVVSGVDSLAGDPISQGKILDGATGGVLLAVPDTGFLPAGDLDEDGDAELVLVRRTDEGGTIRLRYWLLDLPGRVLAEREYELQADSVFVNPAGDLNDDGVADVAHLAQRYSGPGTIAARTVIDGRTLEPVFEGDAGEPLLESLDGAGDDLAFARADGRHVVVTAQDGATGGMVWERRLRVPDDLVMSTLAWTVEAADLSGDGRPDLLVNARLRRDEEKQTIPDPDRLHRTYDAVLAWGLDGRDGGTSWSL